MRTHRPLYLLIATVLGSACGDRRPVDVDIPADPPPPVFSDGLLGDPVLQSIVDLQVARDGLALMDSLRSPEGPVRARAAFALASVQDRLAVPPLLGLLEDPDPVVRAEAAFALGQSGDATIGEALVDRWNAESDPAVRLRLLDAVGKIGGAGALKRLHESAVESGELPALTMSMAKFGIRDVHTAASTNRLAESVSHGDPRVRRAAAYYFSRTPTVEPWARVAPALRGALDRMASDDEAAVFLLVALSKLGEAEDTDRFLAWLRTGADWRIRVSAAQGLGGRGFASGVREGLLRGLDDPSHHVSTAAATALVTNRTPDGEAVGRMSGWITDHPGEPAVGPILDGLVSWGQHEIVFGWLAQRPPEASRLRRRALQALAISPAPEARTLLVTSVSDPDSSVASSALGLLTRRWPLERRNQTLHPEYFAAFVAGLERSDARSREYGARGLADSAFVPLGSVARLREVLADGGRSTPDVTAMALRALEGVGDSAAIPLARERLSDADRTVRAAARSALEELAGELVDAEGDPPQPTPAIDWSELATYGTRPRLTLETERGTVVLELATEEAPQTVQTIARFTSSGLFDGVPFHRVVANFVVQGGDFVRRDGGGAPGFAIRSEFTHLPYGRGTLGMASSGKDTEGSQWFVTHSIQPHLEGSYTAFGWVIEGMEIVDAIVQGDLLVRATLEPGS